MSDPAPSKKSGCPLWLAVPSSLIAFLIWGGLSLKWIVGALMTGEIGVSAYRRNRVDPSQSQQSWEETPVLFVWSLTLFLIQAVIAFGLAFLVIRLSIRLRKERKPTSD
ncbi:MAG: hypothetical protein ACI8UO_002335 [Verrucomicrobiales bacterium]|jgi:hypothetical protein